MSSLKHIAAVVLSALFMPIAHAELHALIVSGLGGEDSYEQQFRKQADAVAAAAIKIAAASDDVVVLKGDKARAADVERELKALAAKISADDQLLFVMIGHGTYDGEQYRFNLPGPDPTGKQLLDLLNRIPARQQLVVDTSSSSGALTESWKRSGRILITATRSGGERNATRFATYWVEALTSTEADRDKNELVTAQEAFEFASRKVADLYKSDVSIATEHAQLAGDAADRFAVAYFGDAARFAADPEMIALRKEQVAAEQSLDQLRAGKPKEDGKQDTGAYYDQLERVLVTLARVDRRIDTRLAALNARKESKR